MKLLGIRFCSVSEHAEEMANFFEDGLGLSPKDMECVDGDGFNGAIFPAGDSWVELWSPSPQMPAGTMLQLVVDDADAFAEHAKSQGLEPHGPHDAHGERIYFLQAPGGLPVTFQSKLG